MEQYKKKAVPTEVVTRSVIELAQPTGNVYESVMIISKRANQISRQRSEEIRNKLEEYTRKADTLEEVYQDQNQIELSRQYERLPKSTLIATEEFLAGELYSTHSDKNSGANKE